MNPQPPKFSTLSSEILGGYAIAILTFCLGIYFATKLGGSDSTAVFRVFFVVGVLIIAKFTFVWVACADSPSKMRMATFVFRISSEIS